MKFLWTKDLRINTVHVQDVCRALFLISQKAKKGDVFNLADSGDSCIIFFSSLISFSFYFIG